jgi:hypothetical protein
MGLFLEEKVVNKKSANFELKLLLETYANQEPTNFDMGFQMHDA